ncbi:hypothetical protein JOB18_029278 [Solea senegalensis]|uniref:Uncharacterized protein n=1 Tax=Solea senegalensis TaxID=28829 RepID=A0AAV6Q6A2_SOLSE|nr:hypothetical protein JOB18_029278 [Solea senegalensis]
MTTTLTAITTDSNENDALIFDVSSVRVPRHPNTAQPAAGPPLPPPDKPASLRSSPPPYRAVFSN